MLAKQALNFKCLFWFTGGGLGPATMAYGGVPNHTDMDDESTASAHEAAGTSLAHDLVQQLGLVSLEPSSSSTPSTSMMPPKAPTFSPDKYSLRNLEIQQTLGEWRVSLFEALMVGRNFISISTEKQGQLVYRYSEGAVFNIVHLLLYKGESSRFLGQESCKFVTGGGCSVIIDLWFSRVLAVPDSTYLLGQLGGCGIFLPVKAESIVDTPGKHPTSPGKHPVGNFFYLIHLSPYNKGSLPWWCCTSSCR